MDKAFVEVVDNGCDGIRRFIPGCNILVSSLFLSRVGLCEPCDQVVSSNNSRVGVQYEQRGINEQV